MLERRLGAVRYRVERVSHSADGLTSLRAIVAAEPGHGDFVLVPSNNGIGAAHTERQVARVGLRSRHVGRSGDGTERDGSG